MRKLSWAWYLLGPAELIVLALFLGMLAVWVQVLAP